MRKLLVVVLVGVALVIVLATLRGPAPQLANAATSTPAPSATPSVIAIAPAASPAAIPTVAKSALLPAATYDPFAHRAEIDAALARGDVGALASLQQIDLTRDGYVAAAAIDAVGKLAALAPEKEKREAVATLAKWLRDETVRKTADAAGNVSIAVDALENTKSDAAIAPLVAALDRAELPLHVETRIVEALTTLRATTSVASIDRFAVRAAARSSSDDFDKALVTEALAAAATARATLQP